MAATMTGSAKSTHHQDHWGVHADGQGRVRLELHDDSGHETRVTVSVAEALSLMDAIGRACKKARAESQEG
jgi:hypothetical protein